MTETLNTQLILANDFEAAADAGESWPAIYAALFTTTAAASIPQAISGKQTLLALTHAGHDVAKVIAAFRADPLGAELLNTLNISGVHWDDPLTQTVVSRLVSQGGDVTAEVAASLAALSTELVTKASQAGAQVADAGALAAEWNRYRFSQRVQNASAIALGGFEHSHSSDQQTQNWAAAWAASEVAL